MILISSDDNHTSCLWSYPIYKIKEKQKKKEKSQLLEHRCTVMVRSGCWSACLNSEGSHHGRSRGLPRHRVHWFPSQGPMSAWLITHTTCRYQLPACCLYEQKARHVGPTDLLLRMSLHAECELSLPWLLHYVLVHLPFWAVLFVWC